MKRNNLNHCFGLEVTGDAMEPWILEGDILYVDPKQRPKGNAQDIAIIKIEDSYHVCKYTSFGDKILVIHDNAPNVSLSAESVEFVGKVIGGSHTMTSQIPGAQKENHSAGNTMAFA